MTMPADTSMPAQGRARPAGDRAPEYGSTPQTETAIEARQGVTGHNVNVVLAVSLTAVVVAAACFSTLPILTSGVYGAGVRPLTLLAWRFALVSVLMAAVQTLRSPGALAVSRSDLGRFAVLALGGYGAEAFIPPPRCHQVAGLGGLRPRPETAAIH